jgi:hypothetical protein
MEPLDNCSAMTTSGAATRAADTDRQVRLAFLLVPKQEVEQTVELVEAPVPGGSST